MRVDVHSNKQGYTHMLSVAVLRHALISPARLSRMTWIFWMPSNTSLQSGYLGGSRIPAAAAAAAAVHGTVSQKKQASHSASQSENDRPARETRQVARAAGNEQYASQAKK